MIVLLNAIERMRRTAAQHVERWNVVENEVFDVDGRYIGRMSNRALAEYVSQLHNLFVPTANLILTLLKKLRDRQAMTREIVREERNRRS